MRLTRVRVEDFGAIASVELELGPGLNVLFGPNDLGKSTLVEAVRLALLLQTTQKAYEELVPWGTRKKPKVELCFQVGEFHYRLKKEFGGSNATLERSRDGASWDERARGRSVDDEVRKILQWGIEAPGGKGGPKGLPSSFLATALLSAQTDVGAILKAKLDDEADTGKTRLAEALAALAQDPLFKKVLARVQERYDRAYTNTGEESRRQGAVLRVARDRVNAARKEYDEAQAAVDEAGSVEAELAELLEQRERRVAVESDARASLAAVEERARRGALHGAAVAKRDGAREVLDAIARLATDEQAERDRLAAYRDELRGCDGAILAAEEEQRGAQREIHDAEESARSAAGGAGERLLEQVRSARRLVAEAKDVEHALTAATRLAEEKERAAAGAAEREAGARKELERVDHLERLLERREAADRVASAQAIADALALAKEQGRITVEKRAALRIPDRAGLARVRKLENQLEIARGQVKGGLLVTIEPLAPRDVSVGRDGREAEDAHVTEPLAVEAERSVDVLLHGVARVRVEAGSAAQRKALKEIEARWRSEAKPVLGDAGVATAEGLEKKIQEAEALDREADGARREAERLERELADLDGAAGDLEAAQARVAAATGAATEEELAALGSDPRRTLRARREAAAKALAGSDAARLSTEAALAREKAGSAAREHARAVAARDAALAPLEGRDLDAIEATLAARKESVEAALAAARARIERAGRELVDARERREKIVKAEAACSGKLEQLRRQLDATDEAGARARLVEAERALAGAPAPERPVTLEEEAAARERAERAVADLDALDHEVSRRRGALEQVGGAVARERLRDAEEALRLAEEDERAKGAEYAAWRVLLEQLKEAEKAQASHLGQKLAPSINTRFAALTGSRYAGINLDAELATGGVLVAGEVRSVARLSVGTREQLSTLYRLAIAEHLGSTVLLDDQLVQSDLARIDWFRALLREKARRFQIIVLTCRPQDYLEGDDGETRAVDLGRAVRSRTAER